MKNLNLNKQRLERIDEVQSQNDYSGSNIKMNETTNLKRSSFNFPSKPSENFVYVTPLRNVKDSEIVSDFSNYGNILRVYEDEDNKYFKIYFDNRSAVSNAVADCETRLRNRQQIKYKVEEGFENQINNLQFRSLIYSRDRNEPNMNRELGRGGLNQVKNLNENIGSAFGSHVQSSKDYISDKKTRVTNEAELRTEKDYVRNRKPDLNEFEYEGDFRQQTNLKQFEERKTPVIRIYFLIYFLIFS